MNKGKNNISPEKSKNKINNVMRWILFGVILIVAPPLFNAWYRIIVRVNVDFYEYIPDILLALLAVCLNLINTCIDSGKKINYLLRWIFSLICGVIAVGCWGFFFVIRFISRESVEENVFASIFDFLIVIKQKEIGIE